MTEQDCQTCDGGRPGRETAPLGGRYSAMNFIPRKRDYVNPDGQITTVLADGRCEHCREYPGHQRGGQAPPV